MAGKLVLSLVTGDSRPHMLALDYALHPVLSALGTRQVLPSIFATDAQINWHAEKGLSIDPAIAQRVVDGVDHLAANLAALRASKASEFAAVPFSQGRCSV